MKTTLDIPDAVLADTLRYTGAKTKRDAVVRALEDFNRRQHMASLGKHLGTFENFMTAAELREERNAR